MKRLISVVCMLSFIIVSFTIPKEVYAKDIQLTNTSNNTKGAEILNVSEKDKLEIQQFLVNEKKSIRFIGHKQVAATPAVVAVYFIPGIGEVALLATGALLIGGIIYYAGSWLYDKVMPYIIGFSIPSRLKKDGKTVDLGKFNKKVRGRTAYEEDGGWTIEKDTAGHGGRKWKLKKPNGDRVASLDEDGKILGK